MYHLVLLTNLLKNYIFMVVCYLKNTFCDTSNLLVNILSDLLSLSVISVTTLSNYMSGSSISSLITTWSSATSLTSWSYQVSRPLDHLERMFKRIRIQAHTIISDCYKNKLPALRTAAAADKPMQITTGFCQKLYCETLGANVRSLLKRMNHFHSLLVHPALPHALGK